jgi:glycosyltransferase involved in cell wall biosynthesis
MRILVDLQGAQTESRFRGIGRYVTALTRAMIRNAAQHEIFILLNGLFPETISSIRQQFFGLIPDQNILVWYAPGSVNDYSRKSQGWRNIAERIRQDFIDTLKPDALYISSLFEGGEAVVNISECARDYQVGVTFYDLIPLLNPDQYFLGNPHFEKYYFEKISCLKRADQLFAISEFSRQEALEHLKLDSEQVINVSTASDESVILAAFEESVESTSLYARLGITKPYVLYTGGGDGRKNLPRLAEAYAQLPEDIRARYQLVLAGKMLPVQAKEIGTAAVSAGLKLGEDLVFTGYVSDADLQYLYRHCQLFVFPSWHEGFGLPALEAMQCGAVVIAAGNTSLPEVLEFEDALFDPLNTDQITEKIIQGLDDQCFRNAFLEHAKTQSQKFSWDISAKRLLRAFEAGHRATLGQKLGWREISQERERARVVLLRDIGQVMNTFGLNQAVDHLALAYALTDNEKTLSDVIRRGVLPQNIAWRIEGPFDSSYSLSLLNRETAKALDQLGHKVVLHSTEGPGDFDPNPVFLTENAELASMYFKSAQIQPACCDVSSRNLYPPRVCDMGSRLNLLHHYAWEESAFPQEWVAEFNDNLQGMTCLSRHVHKVMIDNGVSVPMSVSGCGVDHWLQTQTDDSYQLDLQGFVFLHVSSCFPRKGIGVLLDAYGMAFTVNDPVTLVVKTFPNPHNEVHPLLEEVRQRYPNYPEVRIIETDLTDGQLKALYQQSDALVAPSRAEGFGLPLAEAMLSGLPVITTAWGGQLDFCNDQTAWLIDFSYQRASTHFELFDSVWAAPNVPHLATLLQEVYRSSDSERKEKNAQAQKDLLANFTWRHTAQRLVDSARHFAVPKSTPAMRLGWVSSWNTPCGIASYSEHLINVMPQDVTIFARHDQPESLDQKNVIRCWQMMPEEDLRELAAQIEQRDINVIVIQFNYGFFEFPAFAQFMNRMSEQNRKVIVMLHATVDPPGLPEKRLSCLKDALARCQRLLVHTPADLNRLKKLGLDHISAIFPHGVVDRLIKKKKKPGRTIQLASYGFFLPSKGLLELIDAVAILHYKGVRFHLTMVNAAYPIPISTQLIEKAKERISFHALEDRITLVTNYLPESESFALLEESDLIVFPYRESNESSSAAVRYGLATGRPVVVTPVSIFEDVSPATFMLPGVDAGDMAAGLIQLVETIRHEKTNPSYSAAIERSNHWLESHRYSVLGQRLSNILQSILVNC